MSGMRGRRAFGRSGSAGYARIEYQIPPKSKRNLEKVFGNTPEIRALYVRAEFLLTLAASFKPNEVLHKWAASPTWAEDRERFEQERAESAHHTLVSARKGEIRALYRPPHVSPEKPLALDFSLLPSEFTLFVGTRFASSDKTESVLLEQGMHVCRVANWREEDGYAPEIECEAVNGDLAVIEQSALIQAICQHKATIEGIYFESLPLYRYTSKSRPLHLTASEQKTTYKMPLRMGSPRDFVSLDSRLLKLLGGVNPINLLRLSRFYHPITGIKPDEIKYRKLVGRARETGLSSRN